MPEEKSRQLRSTPGAQGPPESPKINEAPRVNVAFPFSNIMVKEPSKDLAELARIVAELTGLLATVSPGPKVEELKEDARSLVERLR